MTQVDHPHEQPAPSPPPRPEEASGSSPIRLVMLALIVAYIGIVGGLPWLAIGLAGVAVAIVMDAGRIAHLRIALTGTNSHPLLLASTEGLIGRPADAQTLATVGKLVAKQVSPMRTTATASNYRRQVASVLAQRLLRDLAGA